MTRIIGPVRGGRMRRRSGRRPGSVVTTGRQAVPSSKHKGGSMEHAHELGGAEGTEAESRALRDAPSVALYSVLRREMSSCRAEWIRRWAPQLGADQRARRRSARAAAIRECDGLHRCTQTEAVQGREPPPTRFLSRVPMWRGDHLRTDGWSMQGVGVACGLNGFRPRSGSSAGGADAEGVPSTFMSPGSRLERGAPRSWQRGGFHPLFGGAHSFGARRLHCSDGRPTQPLLLRRRRVLGSCGTIRRLERTEGVQTV